MFTGLIREIAEVENFSGEVLTIKSSYEAKIGDSIAINGACLTVVKTTPSTFSVELSPESQKHLALENYKNRVHMEPAMAMGDRFEGHVVQGHVDAIGVISKIEESGNSFDIYIDVAKKIIPYLIPKGSITIDGVSLTINEVYESSLRLTIIPHTMKNTIFSNYKKGTRVNIETDMFARYIAHIIKHQNSLQKGVSWDEVEHISSLY